MLLTIGRSANRAVPGAGAGVDQKMTQLEQNLARAVSSGEIATTSQQARLELSEWAERAFHHHESVERELHGIFAILSDAAHSLGVRDRKHLDEITALTSHLGAIATSDNLTNVRTSVGECVRTLRSCVERMTQESRTQLAHLSAEIETYRAKFAEAEVASQTDTLTGVANRRALEMRLSTLMSGTEAFTLLLADLDNFKQVNDTYGHFAGDELLRQFAAELQAQFRVNDLVARYGGDEFVVVSQGSATQAREKVDRIRKWCLGEYKVALAEQTVRISLSASMGVAEWVPGETVQELIARADRQLYEFKGRRNR